MRLLILACAVALATPALAFVAHDSNSGFQVGVNLMPSDSRGEPMDADCGPAGCGKGLEVSNPSAQEARKKHHYWLLDRAERFSPESLDSMPTDLVGQPLVLMTVLQK